MPITTLNNCEICTQEEFERFKSINERFTWLLEDAPFVSTEERDRLIKDISDLWSRIVEIAASCDIYLSYKLDDVLVIC